MLAKLSKEKDLVASTSPASATRGEEGLERKESISVGDLVNTHQENVNYSMKEVNLVRWKLDLILLPMVSEHCY